MRKWRSQVMKWLASAGAGTWSLVFSFPCYDIEQALRTAWSQTPSLPFTLLNKCPGATFLSLRFLVYRLEMRMNHHLPCECIAYCASHSGLLSLSVSREDERSKGWGAVGSPPPSLLSSLWLLHQEERRLQGGPYLKHLFWWRAGLVFIVLWLKLPWEH